jgi:hypothetical protein
MRNSVCGRAGIVLAISILLAAPAFSGTKIEKELKLEPGGSFVLDSDVGSVTVVGTDEAGARVVITSRRDDFDSKYKLSFDEDTGRVKVKVDKKGGGILSWISWSSSDGIKFDIEVPRETHIDIDTAGGRIVVEAITGNARLDTSGGGISARDIEGNLLADTSGGSIDVEKVIGTVNADTSGGNIDVVAVIGDVRADTSGGSIDISEVDGDINADTSGGSINIKEAAGYVRADTSGGNVRVVFATGNSSGGDLSTSGGSIFVGLDPSANLDVDAATTGGKLDLGLPVTVQGSISRGAVRGTLGSGGATLTVRTSGGDIEIEPR